MACGRDGRAVLGAVIAAMALRPFYDNEMSKTIEAALAEAQTELEGKPSLVELAARISQREPYTSPAVGPLVREDRDAH
jgi:hypothetical protein